jgi:hypothetical protein
MEIKYYAANQNMGDLPERLCNQFREWAKGAIEAEFPGADVEVLNEEGLNQADDEYAQIFLAGLWDECQWDWL